MCLKLRYQKRKVYKYVLALFSGSIDFFQKTPRPRNKQEVKMSVLQA